MYFMSCSGFGSAYMHNDMFMYINDTRYRHNRQTWQCLYA